ETTARSQQGHDGPLPGGDAEVLFEQAGAVQLTDHSSAMSDAAYPRDLVGYGRMPPDPKWPGGARLAVQFVLNYEEGGENSILHAAAASEAFLSEIVGAHPWPGQRHMNMESIYEYGARAGFWRIWRLFTGRKIPITVYGVAMALMRNPEAVAAMKEADWEIATHALPRLHSNHFPHAPHPYP